MFGSLFCRMAVWVRLRWVGVFHLHQDQLISVRSSSIWSTSGIAGAGCCQLEWLGLLLFKCCSHRVLIPAKGQVQCETFQVSVCVMFAAVSLAKGSQKLAQIQYVNKLSPLMGEGTKSCCKW